MARYTPLAKKEIRHDPGFGQHGHPALHNPQYAVCALVHIRSGVNAWMMLHTASCRKEYWIAAKDRGKTFGNSLMTLSYFGFKLPPARWSPRRDRRETLYRRGRRPSRDGLKPCFGMLLPIKMAELSHAAFGLI